MRFPESAVIFFSTSEAAAGIRTLKSETLTLAEHIFSGSLSLRKKILENLKNLLKRVQEGSNVQNSRRY